MITVVTPFQRKENIELMSNVLKGKANWIVLVDNPELKFPEWVTVKLYDKPREGICKSNSLFNQFISEGLEKETQYMILCDDDSVDDGFFDKIPDKDIVVTSMKRGDRKVNHVVWDDYSKQMGHWEDSVDELIASPKNMRVACVGGEQLIVKGKILRNFRYGLSNIGDGEMAEKIFAEYGHTDSIVYVPDAYVLFNYFEDGRYESFKRPKGNRTKPVVLFVGDYFCAGDPRMGLSEWEGNIWSSLESTGLAEVARFHFDKFFYHTGKRPDQTLIERIEAIQPDFIVLIVYRPLGSTPMVLHEDTLKVIQMLGVPVITIWGDLEAKEQRDIALTVKPYTWKNIGTANKDAVESVGFKYMHVPKDPRLFNNPNKERDIDVVFSGSYGLGREERQFYLKHLLDNGINLVCGGSEGRDHFSTEEYADRYKRAKIALSFSKAHGLNVVNARPFEAMSCGVCLFEQKSDELAKLYTPGVDYVEWITELDLLSKVQYYLTHEEERLSIARSGQKKTEELYSAKTFWTEALKK
jgi:hypothetical protein